MNKFSDNIRQRTLRIITGSLLSSSLSDRELHALVEHLDYEFLVELKRTLDNVLGFGISKLLLPENISPRDGAYVSAEDISSLIYAHAKLKKLSRERVEKYIRDINPSLIGTGLIKNSKLEEVIKTFVDRADRDETQKLLARIVGNFEHDAYLDGITRRNNP